MADGHGAAFDKVFDNAPLRLQIGFTGGVDKCGQDRHHALDLRILISHNMQTS